MLEKTGRMGRKWTAAVVAVLCILLSACGRSDNAALESQSDGAVKQTYESAQSAQQGTAQKQMTQEESAQKASQEQTVQEAAQDQTVQEQSVQEAAVQDQTEQEQSGQEEAAQEQTAQEQSGQEEAVQDQTEQEETAQDQTVQEQSVQEEASQDQTVQEETTQPQVTVICLDPGHGGESQGTHYVYDGEEIEEKTLNYYIAVRLKKYLEQYDNVKAVIDRGQNEDPAFEERIAFAQANDADYIVSLHNNSKSRDDIEPSGCMAITTASHYQADAAVNDDIYSASRQLASSILSELKNTGLSVTIDWDANKTGGILQRTGSGVYPDGSACDYYGLIRNAVYAGIPSVIVEHAFLSNESDYRKYLSDNSKLDKLAQADAAGIMNYLNSR